MKGIFSLVIFGIFRLHHPICANAIARESGKIPRSKYRFTWGPIWLLTLYKLLLKQVGMIQIHDSGWLCSPPNLNVVSFQLSALPIHPPLIVRYLYIFYCLKLGIPVNFTEAGSYCFSCI